MSNGTSQEAMVPRAMKEHKTSRTPKYRRDEDVRRRVASNKSVAFMCAMSEMMMVRKQEHPGPGFRRSSSHHHVLACMCFA
jgi:hypothetical protein